MDSSATSAHSAGGAGPPQDVPTTATSGLAVDIRSMVGHLLRRCHQVHHTVWTEAVGEALTPPQYSALTVIGAGGDAGVDQATLSSRAALDRSTAAGVVQRLEENHWIVRSTDLQDRRRRLLRITAPAACALDGLTVRVQEVQRRLLGPLDEAEQGRLVDLLERVAEGAAVGTSAPGAEASADRRPGHVLRRAQQRHTVLWAEEQEGSLTGPQFAVLGLLLADGPQAQGVLAAAAALDRSTASDVLDRLQRRGLILRTALPGDARARQVTLSEAGQAAVRDAVPAAQRVQERLLEPVDPADRADLVRLLTRVAHP